MSNKSVLVSLGDAKLKQISEVMANKTCNRILEFLGDRDGTVSDISRELKIPINTTDYNVKKLVESGLIEKSSHFWSVKGKRMPNYRISDKRIIISPRKSRSFGALIVSLGLTGIIAIILKKVMVVKEAIEADVVKSANVLSVEAFDANIVSDPGFFATLASWEWFLIGAWLAILLFFVFSIIDERRKSK